MGGLPAQSGAEITGTSNLVALLRIERVHQNHLVPIVFNVYLFSCTITNLIDEYQPPFGIFCFYVSDLLALFLNANSNVLLKLGNQITRRVAVYKSSQNKAIREDLASGKEMYFKVIGNRKLPFHYLSIPKCSKDIPDLLFQLGEFW